METPEKIFDWIGNKMKSVDYNSYIPEDISNETKLVGVFTAGLCIGLLIPKIRQPFRRYLTVDDIPNRFFQEERILKVKPITFSDGDTFRVRHLPWLRGAGSWEGKLSENTMQIRLAAIDTPETAKFGNPGQPFGNEAKDWLTNTLKDRKLSIKLLHKDQYSRAVCMVQYGRWPFRKDVSEELLRVGLAYVYRQAGAVYGGKQEKYDKLEAQAKKKKLKIWSQGKKMETASEYKARTRST